MKLEKYSLNGAKSFYLSYSNYRKWPDFGGCELMIEKWQPKILICKDGNYLFYSHSNNYTYYTLMDKNGEIVMSGEVPLSVECFFEAMIKAGYKLIQDLI